MCCTVCFLAFFLVVYYVGVLVSGFSLGFLYALGMLVVCMKVYMVV